MTMPFLGEAAALVTALCWAVCSLCFAYAGRRADALAVNLVRILLGWAILTAVHAATHGGVWPAADGRQTTLLLVSGLVGLALGDLCLFHCLVCLGPPMGSLLMALAPAMTALLAWPVLGERVGWLEIAGIATVTFGVAAVVADRSDRESWQPSRALGGRTWPVMCGVLGAAGQAGGLILAKLGMSASETGAAVDAFPATVIRMAAGALGMFAIAVVIGRRGTIRSLVADPNARTMTLIGTFAGPVVGVWLSAVAIAHTSAGVAATLMGITPILMIPISRVAYGARSGPRAVFGTVIAVCGGALLFVP